MGSRMRQPSMTKEAHGQRWTPPRQLTKAGGRSSLKWPLASFRERYDAGKI